MACLPGNNFIKLNDFKKYGNVYNSWVFLAHLEKVIYLLIDQCFSYENVEFKIVMSVIIAEIGSN